MRVNARLDEQARHQLEYLTQATGQSVSVILRESVARYYVEVKAQRRPPSRFLALIGQGHSGRSDIASNVKREVAAAIDEKFARSHPPRRSR